MAAGENLAACLQKLPQELYDKIYEQVFTADSKERVIDKGYKPPAQLQVDRASREKFADSYYGAGATFSFPTGLDVAWAEGLPTRHFDKIARLESWLQKPTRTLMGDVVTIDLKKAQNLDFLYLMNRHGYNCTGFEWISDGVAKYRFVSRELLHFCWEEREDTEVREGWMRMTWATLGGY